MTDDLTRRHLFGLAGASAAGAAGLSLGGCTTAAARKRSALKVTAAQAQGFVSRPDLTPPPVSITRYGAWADSRHIFLNAPYSGPGHGGTMIIDSHGELIWFGPSTLTEHRMNFSVQTYRGKPVLTWWQGKVVQGYGLGELVIADSSYKVTHVIRAHHGVMADLHEFCITPQGTALLLAYRVHRNVNLRHMRGPARAFLLSGVVQEIDIATGNLLFEWDSFDKVPVSETYEKVGAADAGNGTAAKPFNYFHINSVAQDTDGDLLISARNTWAVYKVRRKDGAIIWRLNGKKSDFTMGPRSAFFWQHHVRAHGHGLLTVFDNGAKPAHEKHSRGLILAVDTTRMHVALKKAYIHPGQVVLAAAMGSAQLLPDGQMFVGWGTQPHFSGFSADGRLLLDGTLVRGAPSYRAFAQDWSGHPAEPPAAAARHRAGGAVVYASWNGASNVAVWKVFAGKSRSSLAEVGSASRSGFETAITLQNVGPYFAVQAHDAGGHVLAKSAPVKIS